MRRIFALVMALSSSVQGFLPAPGASSFAGRSVSYGNRWSTATRIGLLAPQARSSVTAPVMSADGGKVLVTGFLNSKERTDQFVFDILQAQGKWEKIVAFSESASFAKKRLISRKSRYSGLLDVLEFEEGDKYDAATMEEKLKGISAWLCFDCESSKIKDSVEFAKKAGVKKIVISSTVSAADASSAGVEDSLKESGLDYTFIRVGEVVAGKEGGSVMVSNVTEELPVEQIVRDDVIRLSAEAFVMENATSTAFAFGKGDDVAFEYLKELRQNGTDRRTEMSYLISGGLMEYKAIKDAEEAERNKPPPTEEELAEKSRLYEESRVEMFAAIEKENAVNREKDLISKVEKEAIDFLKREFGSAFWSSNRTAETVEEYYEQGDNWDRAVVYAWGEVDPSRLYQQGEKDDDEDDDEDDEDDDEDDDEVVAEAVTGGEGGGEGEKETAKPTDGDTTDGNTSTVASEGDSENNSVEKATKTDAEVTKDITAESKDEESGGSGSTPQAKLEK